MAKFWSSDSARTAVAVGGAFLVVLAIGTMGWTLMRPGDESNAAFVPPALTGSGSASPSVPPTSAAPSPTPTPTPTRTRRPKPTQAPPAAERPPAQPQATTAPGCTAPSYAGENAPKADVKAALEQAGARQYWVGVQQPSQLRNPLPVITVPENLMKAVAEQESGWQSAIIACDGGVGTMQLMTGTVSQVNKRFGTSYNVNTLSGNTSLGAAYLEWLTVYFGQWYFGESYCLVTSSTCPEPTTAPIGTGGVTMRLLDAVIAAYNVGPGEVEDLHGTPTNGADDTLSIPNGGYVSNVRALMTRCTDYCPET